MAPWSKDVESAVERMAAGTLAGFIGVQGAWNVCGYHDIRDQIQAYQREHNISGLIQKEISLAGKTIIVHGPDDQLILTEDDVAILKRECKRNLQFFCRYAVKTDQGIAYEIYDEKNGGEYPVKLTMRSFREMAMWMDWAILSIGRTITIKDESPHLNIQIGYGDYHKAPYKDKSSNIWLFEIPIL
ncbi:MAG: hypothetical protein AAGD25_06830 [Cyanobacteria bacterium P01_F01_bin.150]